MTYKTDELTLRKELQDRQIDFRHHMLRRDFIEANILTIRWSGHLFVPESGRYRFAIEGDGIHSLQIGSTRILEASPDWYVKTTEGEIHLDSGSHPFELHYKDLASQSTLRFLWKKPGKRWEPVPHSALYSRPIGWEEYRAQERRVQFLPVAIAVLLLGGWHFLWCLAEKWRSLSNSSRKQWSRYALILLLLLAFALRMQFLIRSEAMTHADEALVSLMAKHIAEGSRFPLMYYDQDYNGTFLSYILAPLFLLFGSSLWHLKLATCLLSVLLVYLVYRFLMPLLGEGTSLLAAFYVALAPVMCVVYGLMALVGPIEGVVLDFVLLIAASPLIFSSNQSRLRCLIVGLLAGLAIWLNFQSFYYLLPLGIFLLLQGNRIYRRIPLFLLGGLLGMTPLLAYNIPRGMPTFRLFLGQSVEKDLGDILGNHLIRVGLPHILGSRVRWDMFHSFTPEPLPFIVGTVFGIALLVLLISVILSLYQTERWQRLRKSPEAFLLCFFLSVLVLYVRSDFGEYFPRYLFSSFPMIAILFGWWFCRSLKHLPAIACLLFLPIAFQNILGNWRVDPFYFSQPVHYVYTGIYLPQRNRELMDYLLMRRLHHLHCDYWLAYPIALESGERIVADSDRDRCPQYREAFLDSTRPAYLFHNNEPRILFYRDVFSRYLRYQQKELLPLVVYSPPGEFIPRSQWKVETNLDATDIYRAVDGDITYYSHWRSRIESGDGILQIDLGAETPVEQVLILRGWEPHETARGQGLVRGELWTSPDGIRWTYQTDPTKDDLDLLDEFRFPRQNVRYLRIINRPEKHPYLWSVYNIFIQ